MDFTIVTPSFRQLEQLACCIASVADQGGVEVEHIVQDGGTEGFAEFAQTMADRWPNRPGYRRVMVSEKDKGMYDAINRGLAKARGSICAYLNCDEQYLPDTLQKVAEAFRSNPRVDLFFGDTLVLDEKGCARCWRKVLVPLVGHTWTCHFSAFTAAMFFRHHLWEDGICFNTSYRAAADAVWYLDARRQGARAAALKFLTSSFTESGKNLGLSDTARGERKRLTQTAPTWVRAGRWLWMGAHRCRRWLKGSLKPMDLSYEIYMPQHFARLKFNPRSVPGYWSGRWHRF